MKNAILLHGSSGNPHVFWLPSIKQFLEKKGYSVFVPQLPLPEAPSLALQLPFLLRTATFTSETIVVAHSASCPLMLSVLQSISVRIKKVILVAGYARPLGKHSEGDAEQLEKDALAILQPSYDWEKIKQHVEEIIFINSDNDPWGCDDKEGRYLFDHLGGKLIILHGEGHMGSEMFNQPYKQFPFLERLLL